ncbi:MAG: DUF2871 domain-containing protein [Spirochaetes bacterium]|nr:DUF2871 domain-containing protein [Spirochaetota bacterium]MBU0955794.1 DUF2871 domain-containing protein [Spirochaetota bacterium]
MKQYLKAALSYAIIGLCAGVFYRELTKYTGFSGTTRLSLMHGHYFSLGLFFFLFLLILEKLFAWTALRGSRVIVLCYHIGLNLTGLGLLLRGLVEVAGLEMTKSLNASVAGLSGLGHIALAASLLLILLQVGKKLSPS